MADKSIYAKLAAIQTALKAPKGRKNEYGGYAYRSAEDIYEAVKPLLSEQGVALTISDSIEHVEGRWYVKATATLVDIESGDMVGVTAPAREADGRKGMDASQVTGSTSSYARKYALCGLFLIDGEKDADALNAHGAGTDSTRKPKGPQKPSESLDGRISKGIAAVAEANGISEQGVRGTIEAKYDLGTDKGKKAALDMLTGIYSGAVSIEEVM